MKTEQQVREKLALVNKRLDGDLTGDDWLVEVGKLHILEWMLEEE
jgi:hypothetical protein